MIEASKAPPPFKTAAELHGELLAKTASPNQFPALFSEDDISLFADYCMRTLQACPEVLREDVRAEVHRYRKMRHGWDSHRVYLDKQALHVAVENSDTFSGLVGDTLHTRAYVDLNRLVSIKASSSATVALMEALGKYVSSDLESVSAGGASGGLFVGTFSHIETLAERATTEEDCVAFFKEINAKFKKKYPVQRAAHWFEVHEPHKPERYEPGHELRQKVIELPKHFVPVPSVVAFAQHLSLLFSYADELQSAGWKSASAVHPLKLGAWTAPETFAFRHSVKRTLSEQIKDIVTIRLHGAVIATFDGRVGFDITLAQPLHLNVGDVIAMTGLAPYTITHAGIYTLRAHAGYLQLARAGGAVVTLAQARRADDIEESTEGSAEGYAPSSEGYAPSSEGAPYATPNSGEGENVHDDGDRP